MTTPAPPGQTRPYPSPTSTGEIPFTYPPTGLSGTTAFYLWGALPSNNGKTPLICLHGGPGVPHQYILPLSLLYADHGIPVLMYDQIGCGSSTHFPDKKDDADFWTTELFIAELENVLAHFGIQEFDLLGQSWGGMLAAEFALTQPKGLRKLILEGAPASIPLYGAAGQRLRAQLPQETQDLMDRCEAEGTTDSAAYKEAEGEYYARHICRVDPFPTELATAFGLMEEEPTVYLTMMGPSELHPTGSLQNWDISDRLHGISETTVPGGCLVMNGAFDSVQDEVTEAYFWRVGCRVKWVRFALSAHCPFLEETEGFIQILGTFLMGA